LEGFAKKPDRRHQHRLGTSDLSRACCISTVGRGRPGNPYNDPSAKKTGTKKVSFSLEDSLGKSVAAGRRFGHHYSGHARRIQHLARALHGLRQFPPRASRSFPSPSSNGSCDSCGGRPRISGAFQRMLQIGADISRPSRSRKPALSIMNSGCVRAARVKNDMLLAPGQPLIQILQRIQSRRNPSQHLPHPQIALPAA